MRFGFRKDLLVKRDDGRQMFVAYFLRVKIGKNQKNQSRLLNCPISASTAIAGMLGFYKEIEYKFTNKQKFPQGKHIYT